MQKEAARSTFCLSDVLFAESSRYHTVICSCVFALVKMGTNRNCTTPSGTTGVVFSVHFLAVLVNKRWGKIYPLRWLRFHTARHGGCNTPAVFHSSDTTLRIPVNETLKDNKWNTNLQGVLQSSHRSLNTTRNLNSSGNDDRNIDDVVLGDAFQEYEDNITSIHQFDRLAP